MDNLSLVCNGWLIQGFSNCLLQSSQFYLYTALNNAQRFKAALQKIMTLTFITLCLIDAFSRLELGDYYSLDFVMRYKKIEKFRFALKHILLNLNVLAACISIKLVIQIFFLYIYIYNCAIYILQRQKQSHPRSPRVYIALCKHLYNNCNSINCNKKNN